MLTLSLTSFIAGILTVLSPCALPVLPTILGGSLVNPSRKRALIIILSLGVSTFLFTLIFKLGLVSLGISENTLRVFSGLIILSIGFFTIFPNTWTKLSAVLKLEQKSGQAMYRVNRRGDLLSSVLTGLALGPVFTSCSPMFGYILFAIIPASITEGIIYLILFILGMSLFLLAIVLLGQKLITKFKWAVNPKGKFKLVLGITLAVIGLLIMFNIDKQIEASLLENTLIQNLLLNRIEQGFIDSLN